MGKFNEIIGSLGGRKFLVALFALAAVILQTKFGISEEATLKIAGIASAFVFSQGIAEGLSKTGTSTVANLAATGGKKD
jgi:hypothetical protein